MRVGTKRVVDEVESSRTFRLFRAFSDPTRLRLLALLHRAEQEGVGEVCVCDLVDVLDSPQPTVSRHLGLLRRLGLVVCRKEGAWSHYRLAPADGPVHQRLLATLEACGTVDATMADDAGRLRQAGCCSSDART
jgi:ArsR family transcriptional regulator